MKIYFACPTGKRRDMILNNHGFEFGACLTRDIINNVTNRKMHWFFDNGCYSDWKKKVAFDAEKFVNKLFKIESEIRFGKPMDDTIDFSTLKKGESQKYRLPCPDFVVCPDLPAKGNQSLMFSQQWMDYLEKRFPNFDYYLAVQDGMDIELVEKEFKKNRFKGCFVGGTKKWKIKEAAAYIELANKYNLPTHIGGIGSRKLTIWAKSIGANSVDSGLAMIHSAHLNDILNIKDDIFWQVA